MLEYLAITNYDEKAFNKAIMKRIQKYRSNKSDFGIVIDMPSVALIKLAKMKGLECHVDVIEIPKIFFDPDYVIDKEKVKLPFYDEFLALGII